MKDTQSLTTRLKQLRQALQDNTDPQKLARVYAELGSLRSATGADLEGLTDLLRAHALHYMTSILNGLRPPSEVVAGATFSELSTAFRSWSEAGGRGPTGTWSPDAQLGEAFRVYARDSLLSVPPDIDESLAGKLIGVVLDSIRCFERALANCEAISSPSIQIGSARDTRAYILAHRASSITLLYWMRRSSADVPLNDAEAEALFEAADDGFSLALEERPDYAWALKFRAFLLALRGGPRQPAQSSDYRRARNMLRRFEDRQEEGQLQTSLLRSKCMLWSYDVADAHVEGRAKKKSIEAGQSADALDAAVQSVEAATRALREDPEDFVAAYFGTLSAWYLSQCEGYADQDFYAETLPALMRTAKVRARNALSQALATLAGLEDLEELLQGSPASGTKGLSSVARIEGLHAIEDNRLFFRAILEEKEFGLDWETRSMFMRDPLNQYLAEREDLGETRQRIRRRFAIPKGFTEGISSRVSGAHGKSAQVAVPKSNNGRTAPLS